MIGPNMGYARGNKANGIYCKLDLLVNRVSNRYSERHINRYSERHMNRYLMRISMNMINGSLQAYQNTKQKLIAKPNLFTSTF